MKPWMRSRLRTTGPRFGPGGAPDASAPGATLYCATMPHITMRAKSLKRGNTASCTAPPTFSQ